MQYVTAGARQLEWRHFKLDLLISHVDIVSMKRRMQTLQLRPVRDIMTASFRYLNTHFFCLAGLLVRFRSVIAVSPIAFPYLSVSREPHPYTGEAVFVTVSGSGIGRKFAERPRKDGDLAVLSSIKNVQSIRQVYRYDRLEIVAMPDQALANSRPRRNKLTSFHTAVVSPDARQQM